MALAVPAIAASFRRVAPQKDEFAATFYHDLFQRYPELKALFERQAASKNLDFAAAQKVQQRALMQALETVVDALENEQNEALEATLTQLGQKHRAYGVTPADYGKVGEVLLDTFPRYDAAWSDQLKADWAEAYGVVVSIMEPASPAS